MIKAEPEIPCRDYWPDGIPDRALQAYKALITAELISRQRVTVNRRAGSVLVDYLSTIPHEWIRQEMARISGEVTVNE